MMQSTAENIPNKVAITNAGINGNNTACLLDRLNEDVLSKQPDLVVLMVGTNDMLNPDKRIPPGLYEKNYQILIDKIKPQASLMLMTIAPVNSRYILIRQDAKNYFDADPQQKVDAANNMIRTLAGKNKCSLVDLGVILEGCGGSGPEEDCLFQNEANSNNTDGVHPTKAGYRIIATAVYQAIKDNYPEARNIICFGDSITFGYQMHGQGTTEGDSYPAILKRMLNSQKR